MAPSCEQTAFCCAIKYWKNNSLEGILRRDTLLEKEVGSGTVWRLGGGFYARKIQLHLLHVVQMMTARVILNECFASSNCCQLRATVTSMSRNLFYRTQICFVAL